jgi:hypothetical protein
MLEEEIMARAKMDDEPETPPEPEPLDGMQQL